MIHSVSPRGIYLAAREYFVVKDARFYNFNFNNAAAFGTCSHCTAPEDKGTRTSTVSNIWFDDATVTKRIKYDFPHRHIILDLDGTTTGKGPNSWATYYYKHNDWEGCDHVPDLYDGHVCDNRSQIRKLCWSSMKKANRFKNMGLKLLRYDDAFMALQNREEYLEDVDNYQTIKFQMIGSPTNGWCAPMNTGHKYKVHFG